MLWWVAARDPHGRICLHAAIPQVLRKSLAALLKELTVRIETTSIVVPPRDDKMDARVRLIGMQSHNPAPNRQVGFREVTDSPAHCFRVGSGKH